MHDAHTAATAGAWRDTALPVSERVELLLRALTLEEKVAQLGSRWVGNDLHPTDDEAASAAGGDPHRAEPEVLNVAPMQDFFAPSAPVPLEEASRHGLGQPTRV